MAKKADDTENLILDALERALADSQPRKLHGTKANPGIFLSSTAAAKAAAKRCLDERLIQSCSDATGKSNRTPLFVLAPDGVRFLIEHDPSQRLLLAAHAGVDGLAASMRTFQDMLSRMSEQIAQLNRTLEGAMTTMRPPDLSRLLASLPVPTPTPTDASIAPSTESLRPHLMGAIRDHQRRNSLQPMDLPSLYRALLTHCPKATIGEFHDTLRRMVKGREIRLSPFTQAMYQMPEPEYAVVVGREVMYYAVGS